MRNIASSPRQFKRRFARNVTLRSKVEVAACPIVALAFLPAALGRGVGVPARVGWVSRAPSLRQDWQSYDRTACGYGDRNGS